MIKNKLPALMGDRRINQAELSRLTGVSRVSLNKIYNDNVSISIDTINKICQALNCKVSDIIEYIPDA